MIRIDMDLRNHQAQCFGRLRFPASPCAKNTLRFSKHHLLIITPVFQFGTLRLGDSKLSLPLTLPTTHSLLRPRIAFGHLFDFFQVYSELLMGIQLPVSSNVHHKALHLAKIPKMINKTILDIGTPHTWHLLKHERNRKSVLSPLQLISTSAGCARVFKLTTWAASVHLPTELCKQLRWLCF